MQQGDRFLAGGDHSENPMVQMLAALLFNFFSEGNKDSSGESFSERNAGSLALIGVLVFALGVCCCIKYCEPQRGPGQARQPDRLTDTTRPLDGSVLESEPDAEPCSEYPSTVFAGYGAPVGASVGAELVTSPQK